MIGGRLLVPLLRETEPATDGDQLLSPKVSSEADSARPAEQRRPPLPSLPTLMVGSRARHDEIHGCRSAGSALNGHSSEPDQLAKILKLSNKADKASLDLAVSSLVKIGVIEQSSEVVSPGSKAT